MAQTWPGMPLKLRAVAMGFGGGALLFALTLSLFGEVLFHVYKYGHGPMLVMLFASLAGTAPRNHGVDPHSLRTQLTRFRTGGLIFLVLNNLLEERGGWVRRVSIKRKQFKEWRKKRLRPLIQKLLRREERYTKFSAIESLQMELEQEALPPTFYARSLA